MSGRERLDVLIIHGESHDLVDYFRRFMASLGLIAETAINLPSARQPQFSKVSGYLDNARLLLVLATFDSSTSSSSSARPNVYLELALGNERRPKDTIVLQEQLDARAVDLGSNLQGQLVVLPFRRDKLHEVLPSLLRELHDRHLVAAVDADENTFAAGAILNRFLDDMDTIWDQEFDVAWNKIFRTSYDHESDFAITLDKFFQNYQTVFSALIRDKKRGAELEAVAQQMLAESWTLASRAWETVADSKRIQASTPPPGSKSKKEPPGFRAAVQLVYEAKKKKNAKERIAAFRAAVDALDGLGGKRGPA